MSEIDFNYLLKYIIIGDSAVGKSNILTQYVYEKFSEEFQSTLGVEFAAKNAVIDNKIYRIQIWDTAGAESFRSITRAYYKNSVCAFIVYDITKRETFENVQVWLDDIKNQCPQTVLLVLVGNKLDLENERQISYEEGESFAQKNNMYFFETSAKTGVNIENLFLKSVETINERIQEDFYDLSTGNCGIKIGNEVNSDNIVLNKENVTKSDNNGGKCCYYY
jgi:small GTP-binding protein